MNNSARSRQIVPGVVSLILLLMVALAWIQRQAIFDWYQLRNYEPSARIAEIAEATTMNSQGQRLFYIYHPSLDDRSAFSQHCPNNGEKTIVLGCYINTRGIYLFDVTDDRLDGVEEVTAAHETLHAAYDRLNDGEKKQVDALLNQAYAGVTNQRIRDTIGAYQKAGDDVTNELHSILGTEVRNLPAELETYYRRYFSNRIKIVEFSENYEKVFADREAQANKYLDRMTEIESQLPALKRDIDGLESSLNSQYRELEQERRRTDDAASFNAKVAAYNNQVVNYQRKVDTFNKLVKEHNELLDLYNAVAVEERELIKAIDSRPSTIQSR